MNVLLSIKPRFAKLIFSGDKKYEYRKAIFKSPGVTKIIVYESSPTKMIVGELEIENVLCDTPDKIWNQTKKYSGIDSHFFFSYFSQRNLGYAIKISSTCLYQYPIDPNELVSNFHAPQSFMYLDNNLGCACVQVS
jgi:predicted transcriptional regulator